jgi:hypothetical protein
MISLSKEVMPLTLMLATGKDRFSERHHQAIPEELQIDP